MNAELQRNLWLELAPRRLALLALVLGLTLFVALLPANPLGEPSGVAKLIYVILVIVWGSRNAAQAVVAEIRERTWDQQRLSAIDPFAMTWGKLAGSTSFVWSGGALCLVAAVALELPHRALDAILRDAGLLVVAGLGAQSMAMFASLLAVRRRPSHSRLDVFLYQLAGLLAAFAIWNLWPDGEAEPIIWWEIPASRSDFLLASVLFWTGWIMTAAYRLMRRELMVRNGPGVWLFFLACAAAYAAGFAGLGKPAEALTLAALTLGAIVYVSVLVEPKDKVTYRWLASQLARGRIGTLFANLQGWMYAFAALAAVAAALLAVANAEGLGDNVPPGALGPLVLQAMGFVARDTGLFLFWHLLPNRRRGDVAAVISLVVLYGLLPSLAEFLRPGIAWIFYPVLLDGTANAAAVVTAWGQAAAVWCAVLVIGARLRSR